MPPVAVSRRQALIAGSATLALSLAGCAHTDLRRRPDRAHQILFLGDSITYAATWVNHVETWFRIQHPDSTAAFINLGLPSETASGLSEPGHAGGAFPRPDVHERLGRALAQVRPDLVVVCYGMNDGIYHPYSDERARAFHDGIQRLHDAVKSAGAAAVHLTPPVFDPLPLAGRTLPAGRDAYPSPFEGYDDVLHRYSAWLLDQRSRGWIVGDIHGAMRAFITERRRSNPAFTLSGDGVHPGPTGHWLMARELLRLWKADPALLAADSADALAARHPHGREIADRVARRQNLLRDSWLNAVGHKRPGMARAKSPDELAAQTRAELDQILALARKPRA